MHVSRKWDDTTLVWAMFAVRNKKFLFVSIFDVLTLCRLTIKIFFSYRFFMFWRLWFDVIRLFFWSFDVLSYDDKKVFLASLFLTGLIFITFKVFTRNRNFLEFVLCSDLGWICAYNKKTYCLPTINIMKNQATIFLLNYVSNYISFLGFF